MYMLQRATGIMVCILVLSGFMTVPFAGGLHAQTPAGDMPGVQDQRVKELLQEVGDGSVLTPQPDPPGADIYTDFDAWAANNRIFRLFMTAVNLVLVIAPAIDPSMLPAEWTYGSRTALAGSPAFQPPEPSGTPVRTRAAFADFTLLEPARDTELDTMPERFAWTPTSPEPALYRITLTLANGETIVTSTAPGNATSFDIRRNQIPLVRGTDYRWNVVAVTADGAERAASNGPFRFSLVSSQSR
jgi:hypothetical protein